MATSLLTLTVGTDHAVPISPQGGLIVLTTDQAGGTLYFSDNRQVSAASNQGSVSAGGSVTFTSAKWVVASAATSVSLQVTDADSTWAGLPAFVSGGSGLALHGAFGAPSQVVAWRGANPGAYGGSGATNTNFNCRLKHTAAVACSQLRLVYINWNAAEVAGANSIPIKASVEIGGTIYPVHFSGARSPVLEVGAAIVSDPVGVDLNKGDVFFTRTYILVTAGQSVPFNVGANQVDGEGGTSGTATNDLSDSGTITAGNTAAYGPIAVLGMANIVVPSVAMVGDSIPQGQGDTATKNDYGFMARALEGQFASVRVAKGSELGQTYAALATSFKRRKIAAMCRYAICEYGTNDVFAGRTLAQVQADLIAIWTGHQRAGVVTYQTTITPRTSSSDSWVTVANQIPAAGDAVRQNLNTWIRAGAPIVSGAAAAVGAAGATVAGQQGHPLAGYFDVADVMESSRNSGRIAAPGVSGVGDVSTSTTISNASTSFQTGQVIVSAGNLAAGTVITAGGGTSTLTISPAATATATGVAITTAHTGDGTHPSPLVHSLMAAAVNTSVLV